MSCIFCQILAGEAPAVFVYQEDLCVAFMDIRPINPGHVLVVPRSHAERLSDLDAESAAHLLQVAQRIDKALFQAENMCEGVNLFLADGRAAGQEVMHVHLHVIPRNNDDGHHLRFSPLYYIHTPTAELEKNAELIRKHL